MNYQSKRIYEDRIYEGEYSFICNCAETFVVEYSFIEYDGIISYLMDNSGHHLHSYACPKCSSSLAWAGFAGDMPISNTLISLVENEHFLAATVILSSIVENAINNLLWATLIDTGISKVIANKISNERLSRPMQLNFIKSISGLTIKDIDFPVRNLVAHGKAFGMEEGDFKAEIQNQAEKIVDWIAKITKGNNITINNYCPSQKERWMYFMQHWSKWLLKFIQEKKTSNM